MDKSLADRICFAVNVIAPGVNVGETVLWRAILADVRELERVAKLAPKPDAAQGFVEVVGSLNVRRFRGADSMVNHDFEYLANLPDGVYELTVRQPIPPEVLEAVRNIFAEPYLQSLTDDNLLILNWLKSIGGAK